VIQAPVPGQTATVRRTFTLKHIRSFLAITAESNPLHLDPAYAEYAPLGRPVVPGTLVAGLFESMITTLLPGPAPVLNGQMLKFLHPVYVGETVTADVTVEEIRERHGVARLGLRATTARGICIEGEAVARVPRNHGSSG